MQLAEKLTTCSFKNRGRAYRQIENAEKIDQVMQRELTPAQAARKILD